MFYLLHKYSIEWIVKRVGEQILGCFLYLERLSKILKMKNGAVIRPAWVQTLSKYVNAVLQYPGTLEKKNNLRARRVSYKTPVCRIRGRWSHSPLPPKSLFIVLQLLW